MPNNYYDGLYFMESGQVSVFAETATGNQLLRTFGASTVIGELGVYQQAPRLT